MTLFHREIYPEQERALFSGLQTRLILRLKQEIQAGGFTERGLARRAGLSQPHVHNLLKGIRAPTTQSADALLRAASWGVRDLLEPPETNCDPTLRVPLLRGAAGPGGSWDDALDADRDMALPCKTLAGVADPAILRLLPDSSVGGGWGFALIDRRARTDGNRLQNGMYVTVLNGEARLRYLRFGRAVFYLPNGNTLNRPREWESLPREMDLSEVIKARVCSFIGHHARPAASL
jgi:transcriptional regulator with XRE-family HTH domain